MRAAHQQAIADALTQSLATLDSLSATSPQIMNNIMKASQNARRAMDRARQAMHEGSPQMAMENAGAELNNLASSFMLGAGKIQSQCQGGQGQSSGSGMMPGLKKLSGKQAAVNAATAQMLRQMLNGEGKGNSNSGKRPGDGTSSQSMASQQAAQEKIADQLEKLAQQYKGQADKGMQKKVEELEKEARRLAQLLKNPNPDLPKRQDRFLVRMLQSTLSMHKRDEGKEKRKSTSALSTFSSSDIANQPNQNTGIDSYYRLRNQILKGNYPSTYNRVIHSYLDSLGTLYIQQEN